MTKFRDKMKNQSNGRGQNNQNACTQAVARLLGVDKAVRYLHTDMDLNRALRTKFSVRSIKSSLKGKTVGSIRGELKTQKAFAFVVYVKNHVVLLDNNGLTIIDTDSRKRDARKIMKIYGLYGK